MNAGELLRHYERVADAPDAVSRLRRFVLELAVRGKLIPQFAGDQQSADLVALVRDASSQGNSLPRGWVYATVGQLLDFKYGKGLASSDRSTSGPTPVFGSNGVVGFTTTPLTENPSIIVGRKGSAGALNICDGPSWTTDVAYYIEPPPFFELRYLYLALSALGLDALGKGVKPGLSRSDAYELEIWVPPFAEQHRIVAKVDELMALCDRLEAARAEREAARDRLAAASLARLNAPDPETFADDARFALDALPALTARADNIKQLRQTILNLAMCGKLVAQDSADEPVIDQLNRINHSKSGTSRRSSRSSGLGARDDEMAESKDVPPGWKWTCLGALLTDLRYGTSKKCSYEPGGTPVLRIPNVSDGQVSLDDMKFGPLTEAERAELSLKRGDLLIIRSNGSLKIVGRAAEVGPSAEGMSFAGYLVRVRLSAGNVLPRFVWLTLSTDAVRSQIEGPIRSAVGLKNVNSSEISALSFGLPPLAEQQRIVEKVDELMALCDRLEAELAAAEGQRSRLLEALIHEALEPLEELEQAE